MFHQAASVQPVHGRRAKYRKCENKFSLRGNTLCGLGTILILNAVWPCGKVRVFKLSWKCIFSIFPFKSALRSLQSHLGCTGAEWLMFFQQLSWKHFLPSASLVIYSLTFFTPIFLRPFDERGEQKQSRRKLSSSCGSSWAARLMWDSKSASESFWIVWRNVWVAHIRWILKH